MSSPRSSSEIRAESGPLAGQSFVLDRSPFCIGRVGGNELVVPDTSVSRRHACLELQGGRWFLRDLGSSNGTLLNRQTVKDNPQLLSSGDLVGIGDSLFLFTQFNQALQAAERAGRPAGSQQRRSVWIIAAVIAVVLVAVIVAAVLLFNGQGDDQEQLGSTPGLPSIQLPTGLPSVLPTIQVPTGLPTGLPMPTGELPLPTGLPAIPLPNP